MCYVIKKTYFTKIKGGGVVMVCCEFTDIFQLIIFVNVKFKKKYKFY